MTQLLELVLEWDQWALTSEGDRRRDIRLRYPIEFGEVGDGEGDRMD